MTNAEAWFSNSLRPRKPEGSLGQTAQDGHLDSHTAPELWRSREEEEEEEERGEKRKKGLLLYNLISFYSGFLYMGYIA